MSASWRRDHSISSESVDDDYDTESVQDWDIEVDEGSKSQKKKFIKRKLEERLEKRRLRYELDDYENELDEDFDWDTKD